MVKSLSNLAVTLACRCGGCSFTYIT